MQNDVQTDLHLIHEAVMSGPCDMKMNGDLNSNDESASAAMDTRSISVMSYAHSTSQVTLIYTSQLHAVKHALCSCCTTEESVKDIRKHSAGQSKS